MSSSSIKNGQFIDFFSSFISYLVSPVSASVAIVPVYYGFIVKSAQQLGKPIPKMSVKDIIKRGCQAAPTIGVIVGTQMAVQRLAENVLMKNAKNKDKTHFITMLASSILVGIFSAPALAVFNAQTMGRTAMESLRSLSVKQATAIVFREASFVFSLRISGPFSDVMKRFIGDNKIVEHSSAFWSAAVVSAIGHPADTALTVWQNGEKVKSFRQLMRGAPVKAFAVGGFSVFYQTIQEGIHALRKV